MDSGRPRCRSGPGMTHPPGFTTLASARRALAQMHPPAQQFVEPLPPSPRRSVHGITLRPFADGRPLLHAPEGRHELAAQRHAPGLVEICLLYTSDAADERSSVDLGGRRIIKKKI